MLPPPVAVPVYAPVSYVSLVYSTCSTEHFSSVPWHYSPVELSPLDLEEVLLGFTVLLYFVVNWDTGMRL